MERMRVTNPMRTKVPIQGAGLTKPGVAILQFLFIFFIGFIETLFRHGFGLLTGLAIWVAYYGGLTLGRKGTTYVAVVAPPIALLLATIQIHPIFSGFSLSASKLGIDFLATLASVAPFLLTGTLYGWWYYFKERRSLTSSAQVLS